MPTLTASLAGGALALDHEDVDLIEQAEPVIEAISRLGGESVGLAVMDGADMLIIHKRSSHGLIRIYNPVGTRLPVHATSLGKSILASWPPARLEAWLAGRVLPALTPHTTTSLKQLRLCLEEVGHGRGLRSAGIVSEYPRSRSSRIGGTARADSSAQRAGAGPFPGHGARALAALAAVRARRRQYHQPRHGLPGRGRPVRAGQSQAHLGRLRLRASSLLPPVRIWRGSGETNGVVVLHCALFSGSGPA